MWSDCREIETSGENGNLGPQKDKKKLTGPPNRALGSGLMNYLKKTPHNMMSDIATSNTSFNLESTSDILSSKLQSKVEIASNATQSKSEVESGIPEQQISSRSVTSDASDIINETFISTDPGMWLFPQTNSPHHDIVQSGPMQPSSNSDDGYPKHYIIQQRVKALMEADQQNAEKQSEDLASKLQFETWLRLFVQDLILNIPDQTNPKLHQKFELLKEEATSLDKVLSRSCCICNKCPYKSFQFDHQGTPKRTSIYFTAPRRNAPYVFHYEKIFQVDCTPKSEFSKPGITDIRNLYKFPTDNDEFWKEFEMGGHGKRGNILQYTQQKLNDQLEVYEVNPLSETKPQPYDLEGNDINNNINARVSINALQNFNPKSTALMEKLLKNAFAKMKQDARFVLVTLPDAHRLPILLEWVRARYGNIYSKKQRENALKKSLHHFEHLQNREIKASIPTSSDVWDIKDASYKDRDQIFSKTKTVKDNYFHEVRLELLDDTRVCWEVMKPYHCTSGPPRNIFYSYMPAHEYDVLPFRPWKLSEFVDAASGFEKRKNLSKDKSKS